MTDVAARAAAAARAHSRGGRRRRGRRGARPEPAGRLHPSDRKGAARVMLHTAAHRLDEPEARSRRAGADVPAADRVLLDLRHRVRRPRRRCRRRACRIAVVDEDGSEFSRRVIVAALQKETALRVRRRRRRTGARSIARPPSAWCATATCRSPSSSRRASARASGSWLLGVRARRSSCSPTVRSDRAADGAGAAAEGDDDGGARSDDAGRHEAVREARRRADAGAAHGRRRVAADAQGRRRGRDGRRPAGPAAMGIARRGRRRDADRRSARAR